MLGGVQSLALSCYDEALSIPTEKAQRIAVRTQQIIAEETGVTNTVDPLGGSYYVEWLTDELERQARALLDEVDAVSAARWRASRRDGCSSTSRTRRTAPSGRSRWATR